MYMFKKLSVTKKRKVLVYFLDEFSKYNNFDCVMLLSRYLGEIYNKDSSNSIEKWNYILDIHNKLIDYMRDL